MTIKLIGPGMAEITLHHAELSAFGVNADHLSLQSSRGQQFLDFIFDTLEKVCGLHRDGNFTFVEYRPYSDGECRLSVGFTDFPADRLYTFDCADDLLDAMNLLRYNEYFNTGVMNIHCAEDKFFMYIPQTARLSPHNLAILSEYQACNT